MKQKLRKLKIKLRLNKGYIFVYVLIVVTILLTAALFSAVIAVKEKKGAGDIARAATAIIIAADDCPSEIDAEHSEDSLINAIKTCKGKGGGWRLPTAEDLACFFPLQPVTNTWLTRSFSGSSWIYVDGNGGNPKWNTSGASRKFFCVR